MPTITHVFNFGLPMKAEDYTHRIGRTGRAGRDGLAVTFAEFRDRRKIFDIEAYSKQPFKAETIPGMEPKQRFPDGRSERSNFGGRNSRGGNDSFSRDRKFGGGAAPRGGFGGGNSRGGDFGAPRGDFGAPRAGFGDRNARGPHQVREGGYQNRGHEGAPEGRSYERKGGFNDRYAGDGRREGGAPRGDFAPRQDRGEGKSAYGSKPAYAKSAGGYAKPAHAGGGKPFAAREGGKRAPRPAR